MEENTAEPVAIVTGGGQGIGKGIARHLVSEGLAVIIAEIDREAGEETVRELEPLGRVCLIQTDVANEHSVRDMVKRTVEIFGRVDALVNNAGLPDPYSGPVEELELKEWQRYLDINLTGYFLCVKHAVPNLRLSRGSIVNICSTRALQSEPHTEAYGAAKGGILAFTHALAVSLGPEIRANCISPGWIAVSDWQKQSRRRAPELRPIDHQQHPVGRVGVPEDIAALTGFLISEKAGFITGQNLVADGGMTRKMLYAE